MDRNGRNNPGILITRNAIMTSTQLISCLAGELEVDPALLVETIQEDQDLLHIVKSYGYGDLSYAQVLDTITSGDYF